ncbi:hypothetical protein [Lacisediminimonas sp.]|uniref:hypothetical protein n=1 Tax=Lacisediminimonas sp. TaxID=3060582 RepID=UPI002727AE90|nr:hypothetical protein [Lacisediminimonas sp.]MDO8298489.1 hypothetical protein [Lacisediminimonas sp.]
MKFATTAALALAISVALGGCGGGGGNTQDDALSAGSTDVFSVPEGVWGGTFDKGSFTAYQALVQEDGTYWVAYGNVAANTFAVSGFMQGTGIGKNGTFNSSDLRNYGAGGIWTSASLNASFVPGASWNGSVITNLGTVGFNGTPGTAFNYNTPAIPANIAHTWDMHQLNGTATSVNITADGVLTGTAGTCTITGTVVPSASGTNLYDVTTQFGASCLPANTTGTGIAIWQAIPNSEKAQLIIAAVASDRSAGMALIGNR